MLPFGKQQEILNSLFEKKFRRTAGVTVHRTRRSLISNDKQKKCAIALIHHALIQHIERRRFAYNRKSVR